MTLRTKLISCIVAFVMVASIMLVSIFASPTITMQLGGSVSFTATDLQVTISDGVLANGTLEDSENKMQGVKIDAYNDGATELATWTDLNLTFNESGEDMIITFTITNNSTVDDIQATVTVNQGTTNNATVSVTTPTTSQAVISKGNGSQQFVITFHVNNRNNPASIQGFEIDIDLAKYIPPIYERVDADGMPNPEGDYIYFGYYPQTIKASNVTIVSENPESNGYYLGSDGEYYAQVVADPYEYEDITFADGTPIEEGQTYYFKVERLKWRILDDNYGDGTALIVCDVIVDALAYQLNSLSGYVLDEEDNILIDETATPGYGVDDNYQVYANNYKWSELREYLTGTFYDNVFNENEKASIVLTEVDNSLESTGGRGGQYVCENTNDYIFALSYSDVINSNYGFTNGSKDPKKAFIVTDYAKANGTRVYSISGYEGTGVGWLRSPSYNNYAHTVDGYCGSYHVNIDYNGVVPALQIQLS